MVDSLIDLKDTQSFNKNTKSKDLNRDSKDTQNMEKKIYLILRIGQILMESGADTNRIVRNMKRVGSFLNIPEKKLHIHITFTTIMVNISMGEKSLTNFQKCYKHGIDMTAISAISKLSWRAIEENLSIKEFEHQLKIICNRKRHYKKPVVLLGAGVACGGFSLLFGGDIFAFLYTSICAMIGFWMRTRCHAWNVNPYASIAISAFVATISAYFMHFLPSQTPWHPLIACSLFIVPGVPLINAIDDLVDDFIVSGITRAVNTILMVGSMTFGIAFAIRLCQVKDFTSLNIMPTEMSWIVCLIAAVIAAVGFSTIFNTPPRLLFTIAGGAMVVVGIRNFLMLEYACSQATASLVGAMVVSLLALKLVHIVHTPTHVLTIPMVIPLIPGVFMYRLLFSIINIENIEYTRYHYVLDDGVNTTLILLAIAVGVAIPNIFFRKYINKLKKKRVKILTKQAKSRLIL